MSELIFAVGDVHGCYDLLCELLEKIDEAAAGRPYKIVFLGDYVDRGPDSKEVIELLMGLGDNVICLAGNHEDLMLNALDALLPKGGWAMQNEAEDNIGWWLMNGGVQTLDSYLGPGCYFRDDPVFRVAAENVPDEHIEWLRTLPTHYETDTHYFVHAGVNPNRELELQTRNNKLWIRGEWLESRVMMNKHVVHGHSVESTDLPELRRNRSNLDTGACFGGRLTAGMFDGLNGTPNPGNPVDIIQVEAS